ncbi:hypothetical protein FRC01_005632 [Tulasnella sp. 417]|nr:hypothetical protein FRC01_005632 [Tulasnella sp. 417]
MTVTPHQTILLKLLDAHLQLPSTRSEQDGLVLLRFLAELHLQLAYTAKRALHVFSVAVTEDENAPLDTRLPGIVEAIVLVTQALCALLLAGASKQGDETLIRTVKTVRLQEDDGNGLSLSDLSVDLLKELDLFLPRIILGQVAQDSSRPASAPRHEAQSDPAGFAYIKRDLVRLLGILCHNDKDTQDSIREREGIQVIMNLCVVDERNPYLREHALFTLQNLLKNNPENQAVVDEFKPMVEWDQEGNLIV